MSKQFFSYCPYSTVPEIPLIQDVFYVLGLSPVQECYNFCMANHKLYIDNIELLVERYGKEILTYTTVEAIRLAIARAIVSLCDESVDAYDRAFAEAVKEMCQLKYHRLTDREVKVVVKYIVMTSLDENEVKRRLRDELRYPYGEPLIICAPIRKRPGPGIVSTKNGTEVNLALLGPDRTAPLYI